MRAPTARPTVLRRLQLVLLAALATLVVAGGAASEPGFETTLLTPDATIAAADTVSGRLAQSDPSLLGRSDDTLVHVLVKYDLDPTASYTGGIPGLEATSPSVTGKSLKANRDAVAAYERYAGRRTDAISAEVESAVSDVEISQSFETAYGGVAASLPANEIDTLLAVDDVVAVQPDTPEQPQTDATPQFIGATDVWPSIGGSIHAADTVTVGVLDSGIWPEHPSFRDTGLSPPTRSYGCDFGGGTLGPVFSCNDKLVGAYVFTDTYMSIFPALPGEYCSNVTDVCSARDANGHGTHTASTAAGDPVDSAPIFGTNRGPISGIAPGARVVAYRICLEQGCFPSDAVAAVQQAILDDVDVINYSISGGANPYADAVELTFLDAFNAGISVNASAGNSGPGPATVDHGGPWVTTVGASTSNRSLSSTLHLTASNGDTLDLAGATVTPGIGPTPVVLATSIPGVDALCVNPIPAGAATGKIVACERGPNRVLKSFNVRNGGGAGMLLYNPTPQDLMTDNHWVPTIHVDGPSTALLAFLNGHTGVAGSWGTGVRTARQGNVMTTFSSRGPQADFVKPDITAPGLQIVAGNTPTPATPAGGSPGELFQAIAGTSMASPHSAGASALVKAAHPSWTPAEIKSALMTSATQDAVKPDGVTPADPFDAGAGALNVARAVQPTLVFDETFEDFLAAAGTPLDRIDLNIPSVDAPTMTGTISTTRTARNVSGADQQLEVEIQAPEGATITVGKDNHKIHVQKGAETSFSIEISAPTLPNGQYFGRITLDPKKRGYNAVTIPVAFTKRQGAVSLTQTCTPVSFLEETGSSHCVATMTNSARVAAEVNLSVRNHDPAKGLEFASPTPPATLASPTPDAVEWTRTLSPVIPPQVTAINPAVGPNGGYLPLAAFGIAPIPSPGNDTLFNFNVPAYMYGGETYTQLGVVTNGYLVVGGGTAADIAIAPQTFPNAARPNNVIAPFWTDLNPGAGGGIRVAILTAGTNRWLIVDWGAVRNASNATTHSFEVWLKLGTTAASEEITLSYGANGAGDPVSGSNWGAENRDGTSGRNLTPQPANGSEWRVVLSPPVAGGSATVEWDVLARKAGSYSSITSMSSNVTRGVAQVVQAFEVTEP